MKKILCLSPHSDDVELGMGGTVSKFIAAGYHVTNAIFSYCGLPTLRLEADKASHGLGCELLDFDYPVREFSKYRQDVLDDLIRLNEKFCPDMVFVPSRDDIHQDHEVITAEARRAFKMKTLLGYELPWNANGFRNDCYSSLKMIDLENKIKAIGEYKSQSHRSYAERVNIVAQARLRGMQSASTYAECFEIIRYNL